MSSPARELPEVELGDPPVAKPAGRARWTIGRVITDLAIVMVAVPVGLALLVPRFSGPGACGNTPENFSAVLGFWILVVRGCWSFILKPLNDAAERWLTDHGR